MKDEFFFPLLKNNINLAIIIWEFRVNVPSLIAATFPRLQLKIFAMITERPNPAFSYFEVKIILRGCVRNISKIIFFSIMKLEICPL